MLLRPEAFQEPLPLVDDADEGDHGGAHLRYERPPVLAGVVDLRRPQEAVDAFALPSGHVQAVVDDASAKEVPPPQHVGSSVPLVRPGVVVDDPPHGPHARVLAAEEVEMAAVEDGAAEPNGFGVLLGDGRERVPQLESGIEGVPRNPTLAVPSDDVDPLFGDAEALAEGVEVVPGQEALPPLADEP